VRNAPSYKGFAPASESASRIARAASAKRDTKPELLLRQALRKVGVRYRIDVAWLPGRPDLTVTGARLAIFCDGDFWHGRNLQRRLTKLGEGHNAVYWISKIRSNVERDRKVNQSLRKRGWKVVRFWESDVRSNPEKAVKAVLRAAKARPIR
jgi:DNA mismatch endonuclease (patch repair protein)